MSLGFDANLVARDGRLPGLGPLLDADAFAAELDTALPDAGIRSARATYVRYKPHTSCLVGYRVRTAEGEQDVYARAHRPGVVEKLESALKHAQRPSALGPGGALIAHLAVAVHVFPHDRRLTMLARLGDRARRRRVLRDALPERPDLWEPEVAPLRYKPERRWVARLDGGDGASAVLRLHRPNAGAPAVELDPSIGPRTLGRAPDRGLTVLEWVQGEALDRALAAGGPQAFAALREAGRVLASLHGASAARLGRPRATCLAARLAASAESLAALSPLFATRARTLAERLPCAPADQPVLVHGDFSIDQVVAAPDVVRLIDLDAARLDEPTADLGSFIADLEARVLDGALSSRVAAAAAAALLEGYREAHGPGAVEGPTLARHVAAGVLLRATEPFRTRDPAWGRRTFDYLRRAEELACADAREALGAGA